MSGSFYEELAERLEELSDFIPLTPPGDVTIKPGLAKRISRAAATLMERLQSLDGWLDPIQPPSSQFDPSDPYDAAELVAKKLLEQSAASLAGLNAFYGSGVYAIYYKGSHPAYKHISNGKVPIYVGKAEPANARATDPREQGPRIFDRLAEHAKSISRAQKYAIEGEGKGKVVPIRIEDFECRYITLPSAYAGATESNLLNRYAPVWNTVCPGFGKHGDSHATRGNSRSEWDTLHPGREWATRAGNKPNTKTAKQITSMILEHSKRYSP